MTRRSMLAIALTVLALVLLIAIAAQMEGALSNVPSVWNHRARGLSAAFAYLRERGVDARSWERPLTELPPSPGVLVLAAPFSAGFTREDERQIEEWLVRGGRLIVMSSGDDPTFVEEQVLAIARAHPVRVPPEPPLAYAAWREWRRRVRTLARAEGAERVAAAEAVVRAGSVRAEPPASAQVLMRDEEGNRMVVAIERGRGRILLINNASMWENGWIQRRGNLDQLEAAVELLASDGSPVLFDEWHHGRRAHATEASSTPLGPFELMMLHVLLMYALALWALSRPHGPRFAPPATAAPPLERSIFALAALHRRAGHAAETARILVESARRTLRGPAAEIPLPDPAAGEAELLALARRIGLDQREGA